MSACTLDKCKYATTLFLTWFASIVGTWSGRNTRFAIPFPPCKQDKPTRPIRRELSCIRVLYATI